MAIDTSDALGQRAETATTSGDCAAQAGEQHDPSDREASHTTAIQPAHRILITAITERIAQRHLTAAQAASALQLTGPRATRLLLGDADEFCLDELAEMLVALDLTIQVVSASHPQSGRAPASNADH
jgi:predicted XRE-type DNA-binding protein